ncbi:MAG: SH3 domain-containing protein [Hyphomicrobiaceae bacterium]
MRSIAMPLAAALLGLFAVPGIAAAANAVTTSDVNMRAGPSTSFPAVELVPEDSEVTVHGCVGDYEWCDVSWQDARGWISADYLDAYSQQSYVPFYSYAPAASVPLIAFAFDDYWNTYYRQRPWYGRRAHWRGYWRHNRPRIEARWRTLHRRHAEHPRGPGRHRAHEGRPATGPVTGPPPGAKGPHGRGPAAKGPAAKGPAVKGPAAKGPAANAGPRERRVQTPHRAQRHIDRAPRNVQRSRPPHRAVHRAPHARSMARPPRHAAPRRAAPRAHAAPRRAAPAARAAPRAAPRAARGGGGGKAGPRPPQ